MDVSRKARVGGVKFQRVGSLTFGLYCWGWPACSDGIRGQGSNLKFEFKALDEYRIFPAQV